MADEKLHPEVEKAYRRKWREIVGVNPPHEGNSTHRACLLAAAMLAASKAREATPDALRAADLLDEWAQEMRGACSNVDGKFGCDDCPHVDLCRSDVEERERVAAAIRRGKP